MQLNNNLGTVLTAEKEKPLITQRHLAVGLASDLTYLPVTEDLPPKLLLAGHL